MPGHRPAETFNTPFTKETAHGAPCIEKGYPGQAFKTGVPPTYTAPTDDLATKIQVGEVGTVVYRGEVDFDDSDGVFAAANPGDPVWILPLTNALTVDEDDTAADTLVTGTVGANNAIRWTARDGGESGVRVQIVDPVGNGVALSVDTDGDDIIVTSATDGASAMTSTAAQIIAAVQEHDQASQLVTVANEGASSGVGVAVAVGLTALAGGDDSAVKFGRLADIDTLPTPDRVTISLDARDTF